MKDTMKNFYEKHGGKVKAICIGGLAVASGLALYRLGYKQGGLSTIRQFRKLYSGNNGIAFCSFAEALKSSEYHYADILDLKGGPVLFKDLGKMAADAIEFAESQGHLEDKVVGLFVFTNPNT